MAKTPSDKDTVRKIWLAGVGAYGRAVTEAKGAVDSLAGKGSEVFDELVQKGEMLETAGKYKASELVGKGKAAVEDIKPDFDLDDRISKMRARLSGAAEKRDDRLGARVDRLEAKLDAILEKLEIGESAPQKNMKKAPARKTKPASKTKMTTQKTAVRKTAAKKPVAKKSTAQKTTAKKAAPKKPKSKS